MNKNEFTPHPPKKLKEKRTEKRPTVKVSVNKRKRTYTIYFKYTTTCIIKFRTAQLETQLFRRMLNNTPEEWEAVLKENKFFHPID